MSTKRDVRLLVSVDTDRHGGDVFHIGARPVQIEDGHVRHIIDASYDPDPLADLVISAQGGLTDAEPTYGWSVEYHQAFRVNAERAKTMARTLDRVSRRMERLTVELGYPETFASYVVRAARILGISAFGYRVAGSDDWSHDGQEYRWTDASGLQARIAHEVQRVREPAEVQR